ncbi:MAG TPA: protease pro-enzyme activation domain-containing protein [Bryobacteraceae bacterium]
MAIIQVLKRAALPLVCFALLSASPWSFAAPQASQVTPQSVPQIVQPVNNRQRVMLRGNVRPMPKRAHDLGAVPVSMPASRVLLLLKRPAEQQAAFEQFIADAHSQGSASYHRWLTPAQIGAQFGPAESDVQSVVAWLQSQGLAVAKVSQARTTIEFSGTAGQIESAFTTKIHSFELDGETHFSNTVDPQIPAALAPVVAGLSPLNDFRPKPMHTAPQARSAAPAPTSANPRAMSIQARPRFSASQPNLTIPSGNGTGNLYVVTPADAATIYNTPNATLNAKHAGSLNLTGTGVTIGIAGDSNVDLANIANYRALFLTGLPQITPTVVVDGNDPGTGSGDEVEALLDLEVTSAIAPGAKLTLYTAQDTSFQAGLDLAIQRALDDNKVNILNVSFGGCEAYQGEGGNLELLNFWQQAAAQGISVTVSTGDSGSAGCDNPNAEDSASQGLQVSAFASTPYNIAVGGTDFNQDASNEATYWSTTNSALGGSAKGPIPEIPWNDSTSTVGALSGNKPTDIGGDTNIGGAGGGASNCLVATVDNNGNVLACPNTATDPGFYPKPSWQSGFGTGSARQVPDVSLFAADGLHDSAWLLCASGLGADGPSDVDCTPDPNSGGYQFQIVGGTSASSPAFAGMLALVINNLQTGGATNVRLGQADYTLYPLFKQHAAAFHDIATGNISVFCLTGTPDCGANGFLTGYNAAAGYDPASGLGSVDATQMVQNWSSITFKPTTTALTINGATSPVSVQHGTPVSVAITVTSSGGTPTGNVALVAGGAGATSATAAAPVQFAEPSPSVFTLSNGSVNNGSYAYLPGGTYSLIANYNGDGSFGSSISNPAINVSVSPEPSSLGLSIEAFPANGSNGVDATTLPSVPYGTYVSVSAEPFATAEVPNLPNLTYVQQATGTVTFTSTPAFSGLNQSTPVNSNGFAEVPNQASLAYPPGTYSVSASYSGDPSFAPSTAAAQTFTVVKNSVLISFPGGGTAGNVVVEVDPVGGQFFFNGGLLLPTGTVTLTDSKGAALGSGPLTLVNTSNGQVAQATVPVSGTPANATYPGDTNYASGSAAFSAAFSLSASPTTVTVPSGGSGSTTVSITPGAGFTGTVNVTCAVTGAGSPPPTCTLAQPSVPISGTAAVTDKLTITASGSSADLRIPAGPSGSSWYAAGGITLAGILLFGLPGRRRAWQRMLGLLLFVVAFGVVGCGGGSGGGGGGGNTPAGNYTVTVTATSGSVVQTSTITATVQ